MRVNLIIVAIILSYFVNLNAQTIGTAQPAIMQLRTSSPNAQALSLYADVPVSLYTGTPEINIPLYEIKLRDFTLPISLSYHASGIKVAQEASWVGLGWVLNAGGVISRNIKDSDDLDLIYGFSNHNLNLDATVESGDLPYRFDPNSGTLKRLNFGYSTTKKDSEPDMFCYNFGNYTGKFVFSYTGEIVNINADNMLDIKYNAYGFIITDPDGVRYKFEDADVPAPTSVDINRTFVTTYTKNFIDINTYTEDEHLKKNPDYCSKKEKVSWYITEIELLSGDKITFEYDNNFSYRSFMHVCHEKTFAKKVAGTLPLAVYGENIVLSREEYPKMAILKSIKWDDESNVINFYTSERNDLRQYIEDPYNTPSAVSPKSHRLREIEIRITNSPSLTIMLGNNSYFVSNGQSNSAKHLRLKLNDIKIYDPTKSLDNYNLRTYSFTYFSPDSLPAKDSRSIDLWGYANGSGTQSNLIPEIRANRRYSTSYNTIEEGKLLYEGKGSNRSSNFTYAKAGTLESITYPTGAKRVFSYGLHKVLNSNRVEKSGGGLRVESIMERSSENLNATSRLLVYNYKYPGTNTANIGRCSGLEIVMPDLYAISFIKIEGKGEKGIHMLTHIKSDTHSPLETSIGGAPIAYSVVNKAYAIPYNGYFYIDTYYFNNTPEEAKYISGMPNDPKPLNGTLYKIEHYKEDDRSAFASRVMTLIKKESFGYDEVITPRFRALHANQYFQCENYYVYSFYSRLKSKYVDYMGRGANESVRYEYKNGYPLLDYTATSKGDNTLKISYKYSYEFDTEAFTALKAQNRKTIPVVEHQTLNGKTILYNLTTYKLFGSKPHPFKLYHGTNLSSVPSYNGEEEGSSSLTHISTSEHYNSKGDCTCILSADEQRTIFYYNGYTHLPTAIVRGVNDYDVIKAVANPEAFTQNNVINSIKTNFPKAHISFNEYSTQNMPVKTANPDGTAEQYTYDNFWRLKTVSNGQNNILELYKYRNNR